MAIATQLSVAVPWSLTHYIPLNGFHPLYRALFDERPEGVVLNAIDNVKLANALEADEPFRNLVLTRALTREIRPGDLYSTAVGNRYFEYFDRTNLAVTELMPGEIEFHHTAPFPSLRRPFVFHCESFLPVFYPFAHQGTGPIRDVKFLREHYRRIFVADECLGIFSHIPETLSSLRRFFRDSVIDQKLRSSRIGISKHALPSAVNERLPLAPPVRFLFINSAHQNPANFFLRGGHIVLRCLKELQQARIDARLYMRCCRPTDGELAKNGVDPEFVKLQTGRSIIWIENYLSNDELNALMGSVHFMLLPSASLHSVSIMQAMALGAIPVVTDTIGTSVYVMDNEHGIVLEGVRQARWSRDAQTGIDFDRLSPDGALDSRLVAQLTARVRGLIQSPGSYESMRLRAMERAAKGFSGTQFSSVFWGDIYNLYEDYKRHHSQPDTLVDSASLRASLVTASDWSRLFEGPTQPSWRIYTGMGRVSEHAGAFIYTAGESVTKVHDWSPLRAYIDPAAPRLQFSATIKGLEGRFLESRHVHFGFVKRAVIRPLSRLLRPYPTAFKICAQLLHIVRRSYRAICLGPAKRFAHR